MIQILLSILIAAINKAIPIFAEAVSAWLEGALPFADAEITHDLVRGTVEALFNYATLEGDDKRVRAREDLRAIMEKDARYAAELGVERFKLLMESDWHLNQLIEAWVGRGLKKRTP